MNNLLLDYHSPNALLEFQNRDNALSGLRHAIGAVRGNWRLAVISAIAIFGLIMCAALLMPGAHYAQALVVLHPDQSNLALPSSPQSALPPDTSAIDTEVEVIRSPTVAAGVVRKLKLYQDSDFGGLEGAGPTADNVHKAAAIVMDNSRIRRVGLTYAVQIGYVASSTGKAQRIADALVGSYIAEKLNEKLAQVQRANHDLGQALSGLRKHALDAQARVQEYMNDHDLLDDKSTSLAEGELSALNQQVADARAATTERQARVMAARAQVDIGGSDVGETLASRTLGALRQKEAEAAASVAQLETQFRPEYPEVKKARAQLNDIRAQIGAETTRIVSTLKSEAIAAEKKEASFATSRDAVMDQIKRNNNARVGLLTLQQGADSAKTIYETYLKRASEVTAQRGLQQVDATVESNAVPERGSLFTNIRFIVGVAFILALIGGALAVLFWEMWTPRIKSLVDVSRETGLKVAGVLPQVAVTSAPGEAANHLVENPLTAIAEAFRGLAGYLAISSRQGHSKIIAVTSAIPGEGKTLNSICLARTLAATGARVVLLDCDLRRASASKFFSRSNAGIAEIIERSVPLEHALLRDARSRIWFLAGRASSAIPTDLFGDTRIDDLLAVLSERFDHIVIDTPPLLGFADARLLASKADRVLHVVKWNSTPATVLRAAIDILRQSCAHNVDVVLNQVNLRQQMLYGYADGSDYYHRYSAAYPELT